MPYNNNYQQGMSYNNNYQQGMSYNNNYQQGLPMGDQQYYADGDAPSPSVDTGSGSYASRGWNASSNDAYSTNPSSESSSYRGREREYNEQNGGPPVPKKTPSPLSKSQAAYSNHQQENGVSPISPVDGQNGFGGRQQQQYYQQNGNSHGQRSSQQQGGYFQSQPQQQHQPQQQQQQQQYRQNSGYTHYQAAVQDYTQRRPNTLSKQNSSASQKPQRQSWLKRTFSKNQK
jgi:hypothetical protein